jgi:hypothetical protein
VTPALRTDEGFDRDLSSWRVERRDGGAASITASQYDPAVERQRAEIVALIGHLVRNPISWSERDSVPIDRVSAETALSFIRRLPSDRAFPKVAPDGDGSIALLWDGGPHRALIAIDLTMLLLVRDPGGPNSFHFSPIRFDGETIPPIVLNDLPRR